MGLCRRNAMFDSFFQKLLYIVVGVTWPLFLVGGSNVVVAQEELVFVGNFGKQAKSVVSCREMDVQRMCIFDVW